jgi:hypothetical protein
MGTEVMKMATILLRQQSGFQKILENIIFLEDVFGEKTDEEMPDVPFLELARSFELQSRDATSTTIHRGNE